MKTYRVAQAFVVFERDSEQGSEEKVVAVYQGMSGPEKAKRRVRDLQRRQEQQQKEQGGGESA